jgi:hypothetical protein
MVKRFFLPDWPAEMQQLVDAMSGRAFQALQDLDKRIRPAIWIPQWAEQ